jgi:uncharacterized membrane protein required for colicin V production
MTLTILLAVTVGLFALTGLFRGVRRGVVALAGTLLAAVLVDLWNEPLASWLRETISPEHPALPTFLLVASLFLVTALLVGYGGSALLPRLDPQAKKPSGIVDGPLGALLGALNGALIVSYLLRYAQEIWVDDTVSDLVAASPVAFVLSRWLPWFVMAMVITTTMFVLLRLIAATVRGRAATQARPPTGAQPGQAPSSSPNAPAPAPSSPPQPPKTVAEQDRRVLEKINQATGKK